jgi:putative membrane protein
VDHVRRVFVRQSPAIESTYYMIVKAMRNPKIRRKIVFPVGLSLVIFSALFLFNPALAPAIVGLAIGLYLLVISLPFSSLSEVVEKSVEYYRGLRRRFAARDFSPIFNIVAFIVVLAGISRGCGASYTQVLISFIGDAVWWFLVAVLVFESGKAFTAYLQKGKAPRHTFIVAGSFIAIGLLVLGLTQILQGLISPASLPTVLPLIFLTIGLAILLVIGSAFTYREREERPVEDGWRH